MSTQIELLLAELIAPIAEQADLYLERVRITKAGSRSRVVVVIDADSDEQLDMDQVAAVSREISDLLDDSELLAGSFVLEVTSPGVDRPLTLPRHWRKARGRLVRLNLLPETERAIQLGTDVVTGRVVASDDTAVTLELETDKLEIQLAEILVATVEVEFNRKS